MEEIKIGQVLKRLLREQRKSLKVVSRETEIPYSTLHTWYENRQPKDIIKAQRLANYLGITLHELIFGKPDAREKQFQQSHEIPNRSEFFKGTFEIMVRKIE